MWYTIGVKGRLGRQPLEGVMTSLVRAAVQCFQKVGKKFSETPWQISQVVIQCKRSQEEMRGRRVTPIHSESREKGKRNLKKFQRNLLTNPLKCDTIRVQKERARQSQREWPTRVRKTSAPWPDRTVFLCAGYKCEPDLAGWNNVEDTQDTQAFVSWWCVGRKPTLTYRRRRSGGQEKKFKRPLDNWLKMWYNE